MEATQFPNYAKSNSTISRSQYKKMRQRGYRGKHGRENPGAFVALPEPVVERIGLYTHMGARIECAVLSRLLFEERKQDTSEREVPFHGFGEYKKPEGTFILSMDRVAQDLWSRWFHAPGDSDAYDRFYDRLRKAVGRLEDEGWVERLGHPHENRCFGCVWSFVGTFLEGVSGDLPITPYTGARLLHSGGSHEGRVGGYEGVVNVVDVIGGAFVAQNPREFLKGECVTSLDRHGRGKYGNIYDWTRHVARRGASGHRFTTIGAWRPGEEGRADKPCTVPWITFDIDRTDLEDAIGAAKRILQRLEAFGAPLQKITVSFSGKKGFHIRVPSGMAGAPVFGNAKDAGKILRAFCQELADEEIDLEVCDVRQNIRLIGSKRASGMRVVAYDAAEFQKKALLEILEESAGDFTPYEKIGHIDPLSVREVPALVEMMVGAMDTTRRASMPSFDDTRSDVSGGGAVIKSALKGCGESEIWYEDEDKFHQGRSKLLFVAACHFLRKTGSRRAAWDKLKKVNEKCDPPVGRRELKGRLDSAGRTVPQQDRR